MTRSTRAAALGYAASAPPAYLTRRSVHQSTMTVRLVAAVYKERSVNFWTGRSQPSADGICGKIPAEVTADAGPDGQNGRRPGPTMAAPWLVTTRLPCQLGGPG